MLPDVVGVRMLRPAGHEVNRLKSELSRLTMSERAAQWHYSIQVKQLGPVTGAQLRQLAERGVLCPTHLVWKEGMPDWVPATRIKDLFAPAVVRSLPPALPTPPAVSATPTLVREGKPVTRPIVVAKILPRITEQDEARPVLWNPNAAANWSLLLTPAFGPFLHAANWRVLGRPDRAAKNMIWVWATLALMAINLFGTMILPNSEYFARVMQVGLIGSLASWYFLQGRVQSRYVEQVLGDEYVRKEWGRPLSIAAFAFGAYIVLFFVTAIVTYTPGQDELAAEVKSLILEEWQKHPDMRQASIQKITLVHKGGKKYTGFVDATVGGRAQQFALAVDVVGGSIHWKLDPLGTSADRGNRLEFNGGELFYTSAITQVEATRLGNYLVREQFFNGDPKTVQLNRTGRTYEFRFVTKKGIEQDVDMIASLKEFGAAMSKDVFSSAPLDLHLCDDNLKTVRVVLIPR